MNPSHFYKNNPLNQKRRRVRKLFPPLSRLARFLTWLMIPIMYWLQGNYYERPQETHKWNWLKVNLGDHFWIENIPTVTVLGDPKARRLKYWRKLIPVFHMPRFGGWKKFVVLHPLQAQVTEGDVWYVGRKCGRECGVSMVPIRGPVRMLIGRKDVEFFGLDKDHQPVEVIKRGFGYLGKAGNFGKHTFL